MAGKKFSASASGKTRAVTEHGATIVELPSIFRRGTAFAGAVVEHLATGMRTATEAEVTTRLDICFKCDKFYKRTYCVLCGCVMERKAKWAESSCPIEKW